MSAGQAAGIRVTPVKTEPPAQRNPSRSKRRPAVERRPCTGRTKAGKPCGNRARIGMDTCVQHGDDIEKIGRHGDIAEKGPQIIQLLQAGCFIVTAAEASGIREATYYDWIRKGEADIAARAASKYAEFAQSAREALHKAEATVVVQLRAHTAENPSLALQWLKARYPARYNRPEEPGSDVDDLGELLGDRQPVDIGRQTRERIVALLEEGAVDSTAVEITTPARAGRTETA